MGLEREGAPDGMRTTPTADATTPRDGDGGEIRFVCEYTYGDALLSDFTELQERPRKRALLALAVALLAAAIVFAAGGTPLEWAAVFVMLDLFALWYRTELHRMLMRRGAADLDAAQQGPRGRERTVIVTDEGVAVRLGDGTGLFYYFSDLKDVQRTDRIFVIVFDANGVVLPRDGFTHGTPEEFDAFISEKLGSR